MVRVVLPTYRSAHRSEGQSQQALSQTPAQPVPHLARHLCRTRLFLGSCALIRAPRQPRNHRDHSHPTDRSRSSADFLVLPQQAPLPKQYSPVVIARTNQRQSLRPRIRHIRPDVRKILKKPKRAKCRPRNLAPPKEITRAHQRNNQLQQRPAHNHNRVAKHAEERMPDFVNSQIRIVQKKKSRAIRCRINQKQNIKAKPANPRVPGNRLPLPKILFQQEHTTKVASATFPGARIPQRSAESVQSTSRPSLVAAQHAAPVAIAAL